MGSNAPYRACSEQKPPVITTEGFSLINFITGLLSNRLHGNGAGRKAECPPQASPVVRRTSKDVCFHSMSNGYV